MPDDVEAVIRDLFHRARDERPPRRPRSIIPLGGGVVALDYGDEDHAFELTVERVPRRRWVPEHPVRIGRVEGVEVALVGVTVDTFVHVHLAAEQTPERDRLTREFHEAARRWAATARQTRDAAPEQPGRRLMRVTAAVDDELATAYVLRQGRSGGSGTEWEATQSFAPRPPAQVRDLRLTLQAPDQPGVSVPVPL